MTKILILGGTKEALWLAHELVEDGHDVTTSLAGRTENPSPQFGKLRMGGFGGVGGLVKYLKEEHIQLLLDYTHPFATQISLNAKEAAEISGVDLQTHTRPPWEKMRGDDWLEVATLEEAAKRIPQNAKVLLALGSQYLQAFKQRDDVSFITRMVDEPTKPLELANYHLVIGKPSSEIVDEIKLLKQHNISHIICRNSGGEGAYAKILAARELGLKVIMLQRQKDA